MASAGRVPLWLVAFVAGLGIITIVGVFIYGSYSGLGSSL
ncbi:photosystem II protein J (chloroplast) [Nannochloropsis oceanica]|jgi:photosystem II PsbJ protein|uniref:Photosystem II reaction center protein J n=6 Tax=Monodopsidaceae TaxID=425072 RepID=K9ZXA1_9STRA|nr:photosystem II protein J [Nannochloropsis gaditana]YP_008519605.1 photosystem II protein J [Nannochloropsis granulata]YP_008519731.1 photosystem II protein J [Nannochloropsis oculata]YP_008519854.1 photosystem II protein J [Microchloropsis salina]YP_008520104.1 photosystem II protein J [Nannochloropsis oceanica]QRG32087.1 photosystem II protein J [Nannochloropsis limnetica]AFZ64323.1 photosystem II protein J [Nannochloropsis gaditana]AGI98708.1 photosystem II protein J [Nannochloropsis ga|eukprot:529_psbJ_cp